MDDSAPTLTPPTEESLLRTRGGSIMKVTLIGILRILIIGVIAVIYVEAWTFMSQRHGGTRPACGPTNVGTKQQEPLFVPNEHVSDENVPNDGHPVCKTCHN